jgi:site-specific DNA recombinase
MLKNRIYRGEIVHRDRHYPGEHEPIVDQKLWEEVQAKLAINAVERSAGEKTANPSLLAGLLYDGEGHRMTPSHAVKNRMRYRYYVSQSLIGKTREASPEGLRIAAAEIERIVLSGIGELIAEDGRVAEAVGPYTETANQQQRMLKRAAEVAPGWRELPAVALRPVIGTLCRRVTVCRERIDIEISAGGLCALLRGEPAAATPDPMQPDHLLLLSFATRLCRIGQGKRLVIDAAARPGIPGKPDSNLTKLLVRAHCLKEKLRSSPGTRIADLAVAEKLSPSYVAMLLRLTFLAPDITRAILEGRQPGGFTAHQLVTHAALPLAWPDQRQTLGFA